MDKGQVLNKIVYYIYLISLGYEKEHIHNGFWNFICLVNEQLRNVFTLKIII